MMNENLYTDKNRYKDIIVKAWDNADKSQKTISLIPPEDVILPKYLFDGIEIYGVTDKNKKAVDSFMKNIHSYDGMIVTFLIENYEKAPSFYHAINRPKVIEDYIQCLSWLEFDGNTVTMGYCGAFVNMELRAVFEYDGEIWHKQDIYYQ